MQYSCHFIHASSYSFIIFFENCQIFCASRKLFLICIISPKFCVYALPNYSFFKAARMLTLFLGPPNISWHRAPKKLDTALGISHRRSNYLQHLYQLHDFLNKYPSIVFLIAILFHQNIAIR